MIDLIWDKIIYHHEYCENWKAIENFLSDNCVLNHV